MSIPSRKQNIQTTHSIVFPSIFFVCLFLLPQTQTIWRTCGLPVIKRLSLFHPLIQFTRNKKKKDVEKITTFVRCVNLVVSCLRYGSNGVLSFVSTKIDLWFLTFETHRLRVHLIKFMCERMKINVTEFPQN